MGSGESSGSGGRGGEPIAQQRPIDAGRLRAISEATLSVSSGLDLEQTLQKVVDAARELIGARRAALGIIDPSMQELSRFIVSGITPEQIRAIGRWPRGLGLLGLLLREPRPVRVRSIAADPRSIGFPPGHPPMTSFLGAPVHLGGDILGNFYLTDKLGAEEFSQEDEDLLVLFASHAAVAVQNARRFTETDRRLSESLEVVRRNERQSRLLLDLSLLMPTGPVTEEVPLEQVASRACDLLGDCCAILELGGEHAERWWAVHLFASHPGREEPARRFLQESAAVLRFHVIGARQALLVADPPAGQVDSGPLDRRALVQHRFSAALAVPVRTERKVYGVFVSLASQPRTLTSADVDFAMLIAERLGLALENAALLRELKGALLAREHFISIAAHELKTPLAAGTNCVEVLQASKGTRAANEERAVDILGRQVTRLGSLTTELLDVSRLEAGRLELHREPCDLVRLCRDVMTEQALGLGAGDRHRLRLEERTSSLPGSWDAARIEQVLLNLLVNAIKYSPEGGPIVLEVGHNDQGEAEVSVTDRGIGIPREDQGRIFGSFQRATNAVRLHIEGVGLGLHIAKEIVERHGGRIWFFSGEGEGSTFCFTLPT